MFHALRHGCFRFKNSSAFSLSAVANAKTKKSHYDVLGITPNATQNDIKTAYYKLSMMYHPDKNTGSNEALQKFRDITTAYEVLGNYRLRKLYDKGLVHTADIPSEKREEEDDGQTKFYKSRLRRDKPPPTGTGRTPIYDFDEWSKAHYGDVFSRKKKDREKYTRKVAAAEESSADVKRESVMFGVGFLCVFIYLLSHYTRTDHDVVDSKQSSET